MLSRRRFLAWAALAALCAVWLRPMDAWDGDPVTGVSPRFVPPLTPAEQEVYADLRAMASHGVALTLAEKAIIRVLATIIRS